MGGNRTERYKNKCTERIKCVWQCGEGRGCGGHSKRGREEVKGKGLGESYISNLRRSLYTPMYS